MLMDEFLRDIHTMVFKKWVLYQTSPDYEIYPDPDDPDVIVIRTDYSYSEISFNPLNIIELSVTNTATNNVEFYLHFQMNTLKHALELFEEMIDSIKKLVNKPVTKVLLSCTGGLTTGFFAQRLNEVSALLTLDSVFVAVPYRDLFTVGQNYDIILLAPQISFEYAKVQKILKGKQVFRIPNLVFAKYDAGAVFRMIQNHPKEKVEKHVPLAPLSLEGIEGGHVQILVIAVIRTGERVYIDYRVYDKDNTILYDSEIIKYKIAVADIYDILDTVLVRFPQVEMVGISMPGIINEGKVSLLQHGFDDFDLIANLTERYHQKFVVENDVNCIAVGYYASQKEYASLCFILQPKAGYASGVGSIFKGQLIKGHHHIAGEVQYSPLSRHDDTIELSKTPEGCLKLMGETCASVISILDPELILVSCELLVSEDEIKKETSHYIPDKYLPEMKLLENLREYNLLGQMILCIEEN